MHEINGVNSSNYNLSKTDEIKKDTIEAEEVDIFAELGDTGSTAISYLEENGELDAQKVRILGEKIIQDRENFDVEEAYIYAEGEAAIEKEVERRYQQQMLLESIQGGKSREEIEAEVRAEYEKEHPEYVAVQAEGQKVEKEFNEAKNNAMADWVKDNPMPEPPNPITGGISDSARYLRELKEWQEKYNAEVAKFEEQYAKENPNYATYKEQKERIEDDNPHFKGGSPIWN